MAENKEKQVIEESGETNFGVQGQGLYSWYSPLGTLGKWFSRFFSSKSKPYIAMQGLDNPNIPIPKDPKAGDTLTTTDQVRIQTALGSTKDAYGGHELVIRGVLVPEYERTRKERYKKLESMDEYPEISAAFDVFADEIIVFGIADTA